MKSLNTYIFEVNNDVELFNMVNEVLNNNEEYTHEQIEESFDYCNLLFNQMLFESSLDVSDIQDYIDKYKKYAKEKNESNQKEIANLTNEKNKKIEAINKEANIDFFKILPGSPEWQKAFDKINNKNKEIEKINQEYNKKITDIIFNSGEAFPKKGNDDAKVGWYCYTLLLLQGNIKEVIKIRTQQKKQAEAQFKDKSGKTPPPVPTSFTQIDKLSDTYCNNINKFLKEEDDEVKDIVEEILNDCIKALDMGGIYVIKNGELSVNNEKLNAYTYKKSYGFDTAPKSGDILLYNTEKDSWSYKSEDEKDEIINKTKNDNSEESEESDDKSKEETQSSEEQKEQTTEVISDNKDLLSPIAKAANVTGEQLLNIITKLCVDKKGKARKLEDGVIVGLSIMICGMLLSIKKNGKSDNSAIKAIVDKMKSIMDNKKAIKSIIK